MVAHRTTSGILIVIFIINQNIDHACSVCCGGDNVVKFPYDITNEKIPNSYFAGFWGDGRYTFRGVDNNNPF